MENTTEKKSVEEMLSSLENIVTKLENEEVSLEEAFLLYEEGVKLSRLCGQEIDTVEKKVLELSNGGSVSEFS